MFTTSRYMNGGSGGGGGGGGGVIYSKNSISSYSPSISVNNSRATSQESDLYSFSSSTTTDKLNNGYKKHLSPVRSSRSRCSSVISVSSIRYPMAVYKKSKTFKKLNTASMNAINAAANKETVSSSQLSIKIAEFLQRTDHVGDEWKKIGKEDKKKQYNEIGKKIDHYFRNLKKPLSKDNLVGQNGCDEVNYIEQVQRVGVGENEVKAETKVVVEAAEAPAVQKKLSELSVDLAEEHSAAHLASERLDLETAERMRLENEVQHLQAEKKKLQESSEKLETELLCMKTAEVNGIIGIDDDDSLSIGDDNSSGSGGVYKQRYERALRELEYTKRRLQQQHHDDLEQLIALRKQLEKKIADAYEEVEEQRQVVAQWKRKVQKLNGEMSDLRLMLEDSNSRNNLLEKKQRKFDSELLLLQEELRQEKQNRERVVREKDIVSAEKYTLEQNLSALKVDLELKEQKLLNLNRELQEISYGGNTEEEISRLRKVKHELENRIAEQDEELDDLAGQVELLNQAKLRLQMDLEQVRKEHKKEINQRDDESEKIRLNTTKKVKALECQLENEHEERTMLLRERHELERKLAEIEDRERCNRSADLETLNRLRRDLKKTKILLHDAQLMLQQAKLDAPSKAILRQLRNQLEDAECARNAAVKARQLAEADLADITSMLEDVQKAKSDAEEKATLYSREKSQLQSQLDENEEELAEVLKKYRNTVQQLSNEQLILHEQANRIAELESERSSLKDQLAEVTSRLENIETHGDPTSSLTVKRLELKTKELESKLDLEQTTRSRMEVQIGRLKEAAERLQHDADIARSKEASAQENVRKLQRALRDAREVQSNYESKEATESARKRELEKKVEQLETELSSAKADLKLALQRVDDLQCAIQGDLDDNDDDQTDSDNDDSGSSNASLQSFLLQSNGETSIHKWLNNGAGSENSKI